MVQDKKIEERITCKNLTKKKNRILNMLLLQSEI